MTIYRLGFFWAFLTCLALAPWVTRAQKAKAAAPTAIIEPPMWYVQAKDKTLQLLVYYPDAKAATATIKSGSATLVKQYGMEHADYTVLLLRLNENAKAETMNISLSWPGKKAVNVPYVLMDKAAAEAPLPITPADVLYLITPDRFANGNPANDDAPGYLEKANRGQNNARHGGDLEGIRKKLPYLKDLGITGIWINPVLENNMPHSSYHGYAITDFYKIDARFGTLAEYQKLISEAHQSGIKVVKDMVLNHAGSYARIFKEAPSKNWYNFYDHPDFRSNFRASVVPDPHASDEDMEVMTDGWFDSTMPDLNQRDSTLGRYLIQNTLWWIWTSGIDGIRMDTYPYPDKTYVTKWANAVLHQFPGFYLVGEVWVGSPALASYWTTKGKATNADGYAGNLPTITDFPLYGATNQAFNQNGGWEDGMNKIYTILSQDFVYDDPSQHLVFLDNHDVNRFCTEVGMDTAKMKMALTFLATVRGIPQLYYGTEIMLRGKDGSHPELRADFPGGWPGDKLDLFNPANQSKEQRAVWNHTRKLLQWRKTSAAVAKGKFTHYVGGGDLYAYARQSPEQTLLVLMNNRTEGMQHGLERYKSITKGFSKVRNVLTGEEQPITSKINLGAKSGTVLELLK